MGAASFRIILGPRPRTDGRYAVVLRITKNRVVRMVPTGVHVLEKNFNPDATAETGKWVRKGSTGAATYNPALLNLYLKTHDYALHHPAADVEALAVVARRIAGGEDADPAAPDLFELAEADAARQRKLSTAEGIRCAFNSLRKFHGPGPLPLPSVTRAYFQRWDNWLRTQVGSLNTVGVRLALFMGVYHRALAAHPDFGPSPLTKYPVPHQRARKQALTADELRRVVALDSLPPRQRRARDFWLAQFYMFGARSVDVVLLKWDQIENGRVLVEQRKSGKHINSPLLPALSELLQPYRAEGRRYVFGLLPDDFETRSPERQHKLWRAARKRIHYALPRVAAAAGLTTPLQTHIARHTFSRVAYAATKDARLIQQMLGHSKLDVTELYLGELTTDETDAGAAKVYGSATTAATTKP